MNAKKPFVVKSHGRASGEHKKQFRAGQPIPVSGSYLARHERYPFSQEVTLLDGDLFPSCSECGGAVGFELLRPAPNLARESRFKVHLFQLPHRLDEDDAEHVAS